MAERGIVGPHGTRKFFQYVQVVHSLQLRPLERRSRGELTTLWLMSLWSFIGPSGDIFLSTPWQEMVEGRRTPQNGVSEHMSFGRLHSWTSLDTEAASSSTRYSYPSLFRSPMASTSTDVDPIVNTSTLWSPPSPPEQNLRSQWRDHRPLQRKQLSRPTRPRICSPWFCIHQITRRQDTGKGAGHHRWRGWSGRRWSRGEQARIHDVPKAMPCTHLGP